VKSAPVVFHAADSAVVHVMRRDEARARDFAERHGIDRWSTDAQAVIDDPAVTAVYVATPTATHAEYAIAAARAGKHVLVEKPMAMSALEGRRMVEAADDAGVRLWVAYYRRALPRFDTIRQLLAEGTLGRLLSVQTTWRKPTDFTGWRWNPQVNRGGEFYETACHTLDILDLLLGPASDPTGTVARDGHAVSASYRFGDVVGSGSWTFGTPDALEETIVMGDKGTLTFASFAPTPIRVVTSDATTSYEVSDPSHVHGPLVATILDELRGVGTCPSTGRTALRSSELMEAILGS
jgi:predicted dehydrogenase